MFKAKKKQVIDKLEHRKEEDPIDDHLQEKKEKTKQELYELRKQMMKARVKSTTDHFGSSHLDIPSGRSSRQIKESKDAKQELMVRLA